MSLSSDELRKGVKKIKLKKLVCLLLICIALFGCVCMDTSAAGVESGTVTGEAGLAPRVTGSFSARIPANSAFGSDISFSLETGETVAINAYYSPAFASVDFGVIAPDGKFYAVNVTGGSINKTIRVNARGNYTFAIQNNSSYELSVSGYVNY